MIYLLLWLMSYHPGDQVVVVVPGLPEHIVTLTGQLTSQCDREYSVLQSGSRRVAGRYELVFGLPSTAPACQYELTSVDYTFEDAAGADDLVSKDLTPPVVIEVR